jgi:small-conductance mechanosensitive channel
MWLEILIFGGINFLHFLMFHPKSQTLTLNPMSKMATLMNRILTVGAVAGMLASCTSSKIGLVNTPSVAATAPVAPSEEAAPAAAQGAPAADEYAAASEDVATAATATTISPLEKAAREQTTTAAAPKGEVKKLSLAQRVVAKTLVKKLQKAEKKFDIKKEKAGKAAKVDPTVRVGLIIALVGLLLILVGGLASSGGVAAIGFLGLIVGGVILLLALLEVI